MRAEFHSKMGRFAYIHQFRRHIGESAHKIIWFFPSVDNWKIQMTATLCIVILVKPAEACYIMPDQLGIHSCTLTSRYWSHCQNMTAIHNNNNKLLIYKSI